MTDTWHEMSACALGDAIGAAKIDPRELTEHFLERIESVDGTPATGTIYVRTTPERARAEAAAAADRAAAGMRRHRLDGVPVSWKDLYDTAGVATEGGTPLMSGRHQRPHHPRQSAWWYSISMRAAGIQRCICSGVVVPPSSRTPQSQTTR